MSRTTLVMLDGTYDLLLDLASSDVEQAAVLVVGRATSRNPRLLVRELHVVPTGAMDLQTSTDLRIRSEGYVPVLARAAALGAGAIFVHTHPRASPDPSARDADVDRLLEPVFTGRTGVPLYGSLVLTINGGALTFTGRHRTGGRWQSINRVWVVGDRFRLVPAADALDPGPPQVHFDRQVLAFGSDFQRLFRQLTIGVVGAGGTGSPTAEQLTRLGVGRLILFDDDVITHTNLTRIHEVTARDVGRHKVEALARRLTSVGTGTRIVPIVGRITSVEVAKRLRECDVVFGCTDKELGRGVLLRFAYRYLVPVIDCAFIIDNLDGKVRDLIGRVTVMTPGHPCLLCRGRITAERMRIEALPDEERRKLEAEGYVPGLADSDPAVVTFTTLVSSLAVSEMIERIVGYDQPPPTELLALMHDRRIIRSRISGDSQHLCVQTQKWAIGDNDCEPYLGMTWVD